MDQAKQSVKQGDTVVIHYVGTLTDGTVFDTTRERDPLEVVIGSGTALLHLENAMIGMSQGVAKRSELSPRQAVGGRQRAFLRVLNRNLFGADQQIKVGQRLRVDQGDGTFAQVLVTKVDGDDVMVDMNHPLASKTVVFDVEMLEIK